MNLKNRYKVNGKTLHRVLIGVLVGVFIGNKSYMNCGNEMKLKK